MNWKCDTSRIVRKEILGTGANDTIVHPYRSKHADREDSVVKIVQVKIFEQLMRVIHEVVLGFSCDHPLIVPLTAFDVQEQKALGTKKTIGYSIYIRMPRMKTNLRTILGRFGPYDLFFSQEDIVKTFHTLTTAIEYMHNKHIAHRDIKPENILSDGEGSLRIADIGGAVLVANEDTTFLQENSEFGTFQYKSPETLNPNENIKKEQYFSSDIWSLGVLMAELCCFRRVSGDFAQKTIDNKLKELKARYSPELIDLISGLLQREPEKRKTAAEVRKALEELFPDVLTANQGKYQISFCTDNVKLSGQNNGGVKQLERNPVQQNQDSPVRGSRAKDDKEKEVREYFSQRNRIIHVESRRCIK